MQTLTRLDLDDARILMAGAEAHARTIGVPMCIAITDEAGQLIAFQRMEGGKVTSTTIAIDKAFTAAAAKKATHDYGMASQPGAPAYGIASAIGGRLMVVGGGLPVLWNGEVVGGIGVSSGTPAQDQAVAQAGIDDWIARQAK
ncbi:DNA polymerase III subunit delta' [Paracoccus sp. S4493]|uniref:GlcG/HbpS family heme-binding protein n=1 Tax=unclassified Paracoccus (in: a-proteobacteria) TaxID=2688777 RepID=UPI0005FA204F|nr:MULTISPECIES: heme-binding protein [unclassified Paracoccus (in: a-proteobacteria)]AZY95755.1 heme-binding protein [Paracoccus sp. Arc7-R13]KJZ30447.1 DNA polymerase III subunit delta' [Paracoccus sp. S4493]TYP65792.1 ATP:cob(I)alamin adenosyltransferase [Stutzerimonas stutzeri]